jgi:hypothetical protein
MNTRTATRTVTRTATRTAAAGLLAAAAVLTNSNAQALPVHRPDSTTVIRPVQGNLRETVLQLLDEGRHATSIAQRQLIHHDLVQAVLDGE